MVAEHHVDQLARGGTAHDFRLPLPTQTEPIPVEVRYTLPAPNSTLQIEIRPSLTLTSPMPEVGANANRPIPCEWHIDPAFTPWPLGKGNATVAGIDQSSITLVSVRFLTLIGITLALILAVILLIAHDTKRTSRRWLAVNALGAGMLAIVNLVLPAMWGTIVAPAFVVAMIGLAIALFQRSPKPGAVHLGSTRSYLHSASFGNLSHGLVLFFVISTASQAQTPEPATVYIVSASEAAANRWDVLVPKPLLTRLKQAAEPSVPPVLITRAEFTGTAERQATFEARFDIEVTRPGSQRVSLPLVDVQLLELTVDGESAFPNGSTANLYEFDVTGIGTHKVSARFAVVPTAIGPNREIRFGTPSVPATRLEFTAPLGASQLDVPSRWGLQELQDGNRPTAKVHHGAAGVMVIRWRIETEAQANGSVTAREACLWQLHPDHAEARVAMNYRIKGVSLNRLFILIPPNREPSLPNVVSLTDGKPLGLQSWSFRKQSNSWQTMRLDLQAPAEGNVAVLFRMVPTTMLSRKPTFDSPRANRVGDATRFLTVRADTGMVSDWKSDRLDDYSVDAFVKEFDAIPTMQPQEPLPDTVFVSRNGAPIRWQPTLESDATISEATGSVHWTIDTQATANGTIRLRGSALAMVRLNVPATLQLETVRCAGLRSWIRDGETVRIWLDEPTPELAINWSGRLSTPTLAASKKRSARLQLPIPSVHGLAEVPQPIEVNVAMQPGWMGRLVQPSKPLTLVAGPNASRFSVRLKSPRDSLPIDVILSRRPKNIHLLETIEPTETGIRYQAQLRFSTPGIQPSDFAVRMQTPSNAEPPQVTHATDIALSQESAGNSWRIQTGSGTNHAITWEFLLPQESVLPSIELWQQRPFEPLHHWLAMPSDWPNRLRFGPGWQPLPPNAAIPGFEPLPKPRQLWRADRSANRPTFSDIELNNLPQNEPPTTTEPNLSPNSKVKPIAPPPATAPNGTTFPDWLKSGGMALLWLLGLAAIVLTRRFHLDRFRPEQIMAVGVLGWFAVAGNSWAVAVFGTIIFIGIMMRVGQVVRRLAAVMLR